MHKANKWIAATLVPVSLLVSIKQWESGGKEHPTPYKDIAGVLTVCDGHTGPDIIPGKRYTPQECNALLEKDIKKHGTGVLQCINVPISMKEYEAYTSLAFNIGVGNFCASNVLRTLNKGNHSLACKGIYQHPNGRPAWSYSGGKYVQGLQNRRYAEYKTCMEGISPKGVAP